MAASVIINQTACEKIAGRIKGVAFRDSFYSRPFLHTFAPLEIRLRGYYYAVAICHQTYKLADPSRNLFGWDYLEAVFGRLINVESVLLEPGLWSSMEIQESAITLAGFFPSGDSDGHSSLEDPMERSLLLRELDLYIERNHNGSLVNLSESFNSHLIHSGKGYYEELSRVEAFSDPFRKKISFLIKLLEDAGLESIADQENMIPIMDYHMQRVLLRLGCIEIKDKLLEDALKNRTPQRDDIVVREACIEAFKIIAGISGVRVTRLNDIFWSLGRSCCNELLLCETGKCEKEPCTFESIVKTINHSKCYFQSECTAFTVPENRKFWQPVVKTHYY